MFEVEVELILRILVDGAIRRQFGLCEKQWDCEVFMCVMICQFYWMTDFVETNWPLDLS